MEAVIGARSEGIARASALFSRRRRRKKVLMVTWAAPPVFSGAGKQAIRLTRRLRESGRDVVVFSGDLRARVPRRAMYDGVPVFGWPTRRWTKRSEKVLLSIGLALHLLRRPRTYGVVHLHGLPYLLRTLRVLRPLLGLSVVYKATMCGKDDATRVRAVAGDGVVAAVDRWICISQPFYESAQAAGIPPQRMLRVPNAIDFEHFRPLPSPERAAVRKELGLSDSRPLWVTIGTAIPRKRIHLIVEAWAQIGEPRPQLVVVGPVDPGAGADPAYVEALERQVREFRLEDSVAFLGERSDVARVLGAADGFVFASRQEGLPNAVIEALATALPVVTTPFESVQDVRAVANGRMRVTEPDAATLAAEVQASAAPGEIPDALLRDYDLNTIVRRYEALYDELCARSS